jgi:hypothetical protein
VFRLRPQPDLYALLAEVHLSGALGYRVRGVQQQRAGGQNASSQREIRQKTLYMCGGRAFERGK